MHISIGSKLCHYRKPLNQYQKLDSLETVCRKKCAAELHADLILKQSYAWTHNNTIYFEIGSIPTREAPSSNLCRNLGCVGAQLGYALLRRVDET